MELFLFGQSAAGHPIHGYRWRRGGPKVLILGGVHGNEPEGVTCASALVGRLAKNNPFTLDLTVVPVFNPDGVYANRRHNSRGVDLNRNLPTNDWDSIAHNDRYQPGPYPNSEPENRALTRFLEEHPPVFVLSLHSWKPMLNVNGNCMNIAQAINKLTGYRIDESIGYPTPGCLGTYTGLERDQPTITYEIERGLPPEKVIADHVPAVMAALSEVEQGRI